MSSIPGQSHQKALCFPCNYCPSEQPAPIQNGSQKGKKFLTLTLALLRLSESLKACDGTDALLHKCVLIHQSSAATCFLLNN